MLYNICRQAGVVGGRLMDCDTSRDLRFDILVYLCGGRNQRDLSGAVISDKVDTLLRGDPREFYRATLDSLEACVAVLDAGGTAIAVNVALERFTRRHACCELTLGANYLAFCEERAGGGDRERGVIAVALREMLAGEREGFTSRYVVVAGARPRCWFGVHATRFHGPGGGRIVIQHYDSTAFVEAQRTARLRGLLLDEINAAVIAGDLDGRIELWSRGAERIFGWMASEVVGRDVAEIVVTPARYADAKASLDRLKEAGRRIGERELQRKDGSQFFGYAASAVYDDEDGAPSGLISVIVDATERVVAEQQLRETRDHLRAVTDSMGEAMCTLDAAGHVSYMNVAAERLLGWRVQELRGRTLHEAVHFRRPDGSSYPIQECPCHNAHRAGEAVRVDDDMFVRRDGSGLPVSWVLTPFRSGGTNNSVIVFSDNTRAKTTQQRLHFEIEQFSQVRDLYEALQEQRFELFAQPIVDLTTGAVVSHELLLRMRERDGRIRMPSAFLPAAERCGLILELDRWVIRQAATLAGRGYRVELNLSAASLGDPGLFDLFADAIAESGADPARMVIELTETALMQDEGMAATFIERAGALGCELALDDFGTGFGGFGYLKSLSVDYLKIDVEFVRDVRTNVASRHVVQAVVGLAAAFGQRTVAEGVEDDPTLQMIREMGVDLAQGYGIGAAGPLAVTLQAATDRPHEAGPAAMIAEPDPRPTAAPADDTVRT
jgi:PAS domain S-box-containing protein